MPSTLTEKDRIFAILGSRTGLTPPSILDPFLKGASGATDETLADLLVGHGALIAEDRTLLDGMVDAMLRVHGGDSSSVLAALEVAPAGMVVAGGSDDPTRFQSSADDATLGMGRDSVASEVAINQGKSRFRPIRLHARGGLGEVFLAFDDELNREVALKLIQERHADRPEHRARFLVEAEVTGRLEHPGIVPVYSLGAGPDGRPYYAMRFIRGESFEGAIADFHRSPSAPSDRALALRRLLGRLVDACEAMAYAHSRGVLHRDLKPSNIMLGDFGETLVVDWGLAGAVKRDPTPSSAGESQGEGEWQGEHEGDRSASPVPGSAATVAGSVIGTPSYMSPEQARGEVDRLGPATDIFSLGATLYVLLTGRPPRGGISLPDLLDQAQRGQVTPPRAIRADVPVALEAICLKAMAAMPEGRYATALALADDLEHWLADESVTACREPWTIRLARWRRRHSNFVTAAAAVLVASALALALGAAAINTERSVAIVERDRARRERARAEQEYRLARRAVDDSFTRISQDVLLNVPGLQPLRRDLLTAARSYYLEFLSDHNDDPSLRAELARTQTRLGDIAEILGEKDEALRSFEAAVQLWDALVAARPGDRGDRLALALALEHFGHSLLIRSNSLPLAQANLERAIGLLEAIPELPGDGGRVLSGLSSAYANLGAVSQRTQRPDQSLSLYRRAVAIREDLVRAYPDRLDLRAGLAQLLGDLARLYLFVGPPSEGVRANARAIDLLEGLHRERPEVALYTYDLGSALADQGRVEAYDGEWEASRIHLARAEELLATLVRENPRATEYRVNLAVLANMLANQDRHEGRIDLASRHVAVSRDLFSGLAREHPEIADYREALSQAFNITGRIAATEGRRADALTAFDRAVTLVAELPDQVPSHPYNAACNLALGLSLIAADPNRPSPAERKEIETRATRAMDALQKTSDAGFTNVEMFLNDSDLDPLRSRDDFRDWLGRLLDRGFPTAPFGP